jgi:hypothetical protein
MTHYKKEKSIMKSWSIKTVLSILLTASSLFFANPLFASEIPAMMSHEGYLTDRAGVPIDGPIEMSFTLYNDRGGMLWMESRTVPVTKGNYSINLGEMAPIELPFDQPYQLGITVNGEDMSQKYQLTSAPYAFGTQPIVLITEANFGDAVVREGSMVFFEGNFTITEDYDILDYRNLTISGGNFFGNGDVEIDLSPKTVISGASFQNVRFGGNDVTFEKCSFSGDIQFPSGNTILRDCDLSGVTASSGIILENSEIRFSTLSGVDRLAGCEIENSTIGDWTFNKSIMVSSCTIRDSIVNLGYGSRFVGNQCRKTHIGIWEDANGSIVVNNNNFTRVHDEEKEVIFVKANSSNARSFVIDANTFMMGDSDSSIFAITVVGNPVGMNQILKISGNTFTNGVNAIGFLGNFPTVVSDNVTRNISLGVQTSSDYLQVINNHHFR